MRKWFYGREDRRILTLDGVSFEVPKGAFVSLVGPSGCGKSTVLNCIAGFELPDEGSVHHDGRRVEGLNVGIGYLTQKDHLLPWRSVLDNVWLPLQARGVGAAGRERAREFLALVGLAEFERHYPRELSGGMLKRVALARTLVFHPTTLLMDEPFGNLDAQTKLTLQRELLDIWQREGQTVLFVTHDLEEAIALSDEVVVLSRRPATVKEVLRVALPRPRDPVAIRFERPFQELHRRLWELIDAQGPGGEADAAP